jgi:hypothetical protein
LHDRRKWRGRPENYFDSIHISELTIRLDNGHAMPLFIHNGHESVKRIARKPRNHAGLFHNRLISFLKDRRSFFDRSPKKASARSTYRSFIQAVHNVIHKDCGQISGAGMHTGRRVNSSVAQLRMRAPPTSRQLAAADLSV